MSGGNKGSTVFKSHFHISALKGLRNFAALQVQHTHTHRPLSVWGCAYVELQLPARLESHAEVCMNVAPAAQLPLSLSPSIPLTHMLTKQNGLFVA